MRRSATHRSLDRLRGLWRQGLRARWQTLRAPVLLGIGLAALVLGTIGYLHLKSVTPRYGFLDALYRSITLFVFAGAAPPPIPPTLQIARIAAPLLTGYATIGALIALFRDQARVLGIRLFVRQHVIVAGLGSTGHRLAAALVDREPVVVIERNPANEHLAGARLRGVRTLIGDAADPAVLRRAGLHRARTLAVLCGPGGTNVDVAAAAAGIAEPRAHPLTVLVHLRDTDLWSSLAAEGATFRGHRTDIRLGYCNVLSAGAQLMLERDPPFTAGAEHILLVGMEGVGEQVVVGLARVWAASGRDGRFELTLTGPAAAADLARLRARHPALERFCALHCLPLAIESAAFQSGAAMTIGSPGRPIARAYVALLDEGDALLAALALHSRPEHAGVPVTVAVADAAAGVSVVLGSDHGRFAEIRPFGVLSEAVSDDLLLRGVGELIARAQHAQWLRRELARGTRSQDNPNLCPWEELDEAARERNRRFADDLHVKLAMIGAMLVPVPLPDPARPDLAFTADELDRLARHEHERWMTTLHAEGWRYGPTRDDALRVHDQLKPWEELDEPNRAKDREAVLALPRMLEFAGFEIRRVTSRAGSSGTRSSTAARG